jgi:two-component system LytT family response regulator
VLRTTEIIMCKADGYCTVFHLDKKRKITGSKNLKYYEDILSKANFLRVHHSFIVNLNHVRSYTRQGEILLTEENRASLGDSFKNAFLEKFIRK